MSAAIGSLTSFFSLMGVWDQEMLVQKMWMQWWKRGVRGEKPSRPVDLWTARAWRGQPVGSGSTSK